MNLKKKYAEFKRFPLMIKLCFIPAIVLGLLFIALVAWIAINNPLWLLTEAVTLLFALSLFKLFVFYLRDYPKLKAKMEEERREKLRPFE